MGLFGDRKRRLKETRKGLSEGRASQGLHTTGLGTALVVWDFRVLLGSNSSVCLPLDNYVYGIFLYRSIDKLYDCTCRSLCVYMSVCLYVYISIYPHIYICIHIYIYIHTHPYTFMCTCLHYIYICLCTFKYICIRHIYISVFYLLICTYVHMHMNIHTHVHTYMHTFIHAYIHTYIHTCTEKYVYVHIRICMSTYT